MDGLMFTYRDYLLHNNVSDIRMCRLLVATWWGPRRATSTGVRVRTTSSISTLTMATRYVGHHAFVFTGMLNDVTLALKKSRDTDQFRVSSLHL